MNLDRNLKKIINALRDNKDESAVEVLDRIGTNCSEDEVRRLTAKALVERNTNSSLAIVISEVGKGINDLSTNVAMSTINEILSLKDKERALEILIQTEQNNEDMNVKETARSVKALVEFS